MFELNLAHPMSHAQEFTIGCSFPPERVRVANHTVKVHLDGSRIGLSRNSFGKDVEQRDDRVRYFSGAVVREKGIIRPFRFEALELTGTPESLRLEYRLFTHDATIDDDLGLRTAEKPFGEVTLAVYSVEHWEPLDEIKAKQRVPNDEYLAHERSNKCISDCVKYVFDYLKPPLKSNKLH